MRRLISSRRRRRRSCAEAFCSDSGRGSGISLGVRLREFYCRSSEAPSGAVELYSALNPRRLFSRPRRFVRRWRRR
ncbi:MAG: hypothetical protein DMF67_19955 [Acidobacteria bacterium]|nr:MAG: hypothetical protein DMF67_19955 [Acidobacteriota bacterium]